MAASTGILSDLNFKPLVRACLQELPHNPLACDEMATWDVSRVTDGSVLFWEPLNNGNNDWKMSDGAAFFNVDISAWETTSFTDMHSMFHGASAFNQPIENWDVSNVTNMSRLFQGAKAFNQSLEKWKTEQVINMSHMFRYTGQFFHDNLPLDWNVTQVHHFEYMFHDSGFNGKIGQWDVSRSQDFVSMFDGAARFNQPLQNWTVSGAESLSRMFHNARSFNQDLSNWDVTGMTDMSDMFSGAESFGQILCWDTKSSNVSMDRILEGTKPGAKIDDNIVHCHNQKLKEELQQNPWLAVKDAVKADNHSWPIVLLGMLVLLLPLLSILILCYCQCRYFRKNKNINIKRTSKRTGRKRRKRRGPNLFVEEEEVFFGETDGEILQHEAEYRRQQRHQQEAEQFWGVPEGEISFETEDPSDEEDDNREQPSIFGNSFFMTQSLSLLASLSAPVAATTKDLSLEEECTIEGFSLQALNKGQDEGILC